jgi:hypothetical protein
MQAATLIAGRATNHLFLDGNKRAAVTAGLIFQEAKRLSIAVFVIRSNGVSRPPPLTIVRCPTVRGGGRLGLLSILYGFIHEGKRVRMSGAGANRDQLSAAADLCAALPRAVQHPGFHLYHIGSGNAPTLREL